MKRVGVLTLKDPPRPRKRLFQGGGGVGRRDVCGARRLTPGVETGPGPKISAAQRPAPWLPPPCLLSISRNYTRSSAASMKTYEGCRRGYWGLQGQVKRGRAELWGAQPYALLKEKLPPSSHTRSLFSPFLISIHPPTPAPRIALLPVKVVLRHGTWSVVSLGF